MLLDWNLTGMDYSTHVASSEVASSQLRHRRCCGLADAFTELCCRREAELKRPRRFLFVYLGAQLLQRFDFLILFFAAILVSALWLLKAR